MVTGVLVLLACQLAGEFTVRAVHAPVPGPVAGMVLLLVLLQLTRPHLRLDDPAGGTRPHRRQAARREAMRTADDALRHLQLLFVPAGAGIVDHLPELARSWLPVAGGLVVPWAVTLAVAGSVGVASRRVQARLAARRSPAGEVR